MTEPADLKYLGKLGEEVNELSSAIFRCIIQGIDETSPTSEKTNKEWLTEEVADVLANISLVVDYLILDSDVIENRIKNKIDRLKKWHQALIRV